MHEAPLFIGLQPVCTIPAAIWIPDVCDDQPSGIRISFIICLEDVAKAVRLNPSQVEYSALMRTYSAVKSQVRNSQVAWPIPRSTRTWTVRRSIVS